MPQVVELHYITRSKPIIAKYPYTYYKQALFLHDFQSA